MNNNKTTLIIMKNIEWALFFDCLETAQTCFRLDFSALCFSPAFPCERMFILVNWDYIVSDCDNKMWHFLQILVFIMYSIIKLGQYT